MKEQLAHRLFDDYLDEIYPPYIIAGCEYIPSEILKEVDPVNYRCAFNDWCDSENIEVDYE